MSDGPEAAEPVRELLAGLIHALNNPLAVVLGEAILLEEEGQGTALGERAARTRRAAETAAAILSAVAALARRPEPLREALDLHEVAREAAEAGEGPAVRLELAPGPLSVAGDRRQIGQALARLLANGREAAQSGPPPPTVTLRSGREGGTAWIEVEDTGPGVPVDLAPRIFEPFVSGRPRAAGLGLPFARAVAEAHGGRLELRPGPGGARFRLEIPASAARPLDRPAPPAATGRRALVVDDEPDLAETLAEILEDEGFAVDLAPHGAAAIERLSGQDYDLILSDLAMPGVGGAALGAWIAAHRPHLVAGLAFLSGEAPRGAETGGRPVLLKPFTPAELRALLRRLRSSA